MITGGSEAALTRLGLAGFAAMRALSERNDDPTRASRPFDRDRDGFVLSEGAGMLVFEELEHAKARGAKIYAEMIGYGMSADGGHITQPDKDGIGAAHAMRLAMQDAGIDPAEVDYINAHGTSTPLGDSGRDDGHQVGLQGPRPQGEHFQHEEPAGPSLGRQRRRRADLLHSGHPRRRDPADDQLRRRPTRRAIWTTRPTRPGSGRSQWPCRTVSALAATTAR